MKRIGLFILLLLSLALPVCAQQLNPGGFVGPNTNAIFPPGPVSITGNGLNGSDQITGIANMNSELWANNFGGADIGAKINSAIQSAPTGAIIRIPQGVYSFSTTIQCPINGGPMYIIRGAGMGASQDVGKSTVLRYTGAGSAIDQTVTIGGFQNSPGCQLEDLKLDGSSGGTSTNVGMSFGGTMYTRFTNVAVEKFNIGIKVHNTSGMFTERYYANNLAMQQNHIGWQWLVDNGAQSSVGHFNLDPVFCNPAGSGTDACFQTNSAGTPGALVYDGTININGNIGTGPGGDAVFNLTTPGDQFLDLVIQGYPECNETTPPGCVRFKAAAGTYPNSNVFLLWMDAPGFSDSFAGGFLAGTSPFIGWDGFTLPAGIFTAYSMMATRDYRAEETGYTPTAYAGIDELWGDPVTHRWRVNENGGPNLYLPREVTQATVGFGSSPIAPNNCLAPTTQTATGAVPTDIVVWSRSGPPIVGTDSNLIIHAWATANTANFLLCNPTATSITPPVVTLNFMVVRP